MASRLNDWFEECKKNEEKMRKKDRKAKAEGKLVGRYVRERIADGYAFYEIIRENKQSVRIRLITGIGDDWVVPYWNEEATIPKDYALQNIGFRDRLAMVIHGDNQ